MADHYGALKKGRMENKKKEDKKRGVAEQAKEVVRQRKEIFRVFLNLVFLLI